MYLYMYESLHHWVINILLALLALVLLGTYNHLQSRFIVSGHRGVRDILAPGFTKFLVLKAE